LYKKELDNLINQNKLPKSFLLYGEEFYTNYYLKKMSTLVTSSKENILSFYFDEYDFRVAKEFISQQSLFGDINFLYIKSDKKIPKKELDSLVELCVKNDTSYFYFEYVGDDSKASDIAKSFTKKKGGDFVRFFKPNFGEMVGVLQNRARELGVDIDSYALRELITKENENLTLCYNDLEKLSLLNKKVTAEDINREIYGMGEIAIDDFVIKLLQKEDIYDDVSTLIESGSDEIKIINAITNYISMLLSFHLYIKAYGDFNTKEIVGFNLPPFLAKQRASLSIKFSIKIYENMLKELLLSEYAIKNEKNIEKNSFLYATLIKLQSYL